MKFLFDDVFEMEIFCEGLDKLKIIYTKEFLNDKVIVYADDYLGAASNIYEELMQLSEADVTISITCAKCQCKRSYPFKLEEGLMLATFECTSCGYKTHLSISS